jgi:hypothetical protein
MIKSTKASILNKAIAGTVDFEAALPAYSQYRRTELDPITKQLVYPFRILMEQLTKHSSLTPGFKQNYSLKEWFQRLPEMSLEEKFTLFSVMINSSPKLHPSYLQLNSEAAEKKKAYRQKKKESKES